MDTNELKQKLENRFKELPTVVQRAIISADVEGHLRDLSRNYKLHLDQWEKLENEVTLALYGFQPVENLPKNIAQEVGVSQEVAVALAESISEFVFEPIREQLERELEHPDSVAGHDTTVQATPVPMAPAPAEPITQAVVPQTGVSVPTVPAAAATIAPPVTPATPPALAPTAKVERAPISSSYMASQPSHERKVVEGDPYREQIA